MSKADRSSSDIQKAFTSVFADIEVLVDQQLSKTRDKGLPVKVGMNTPCLWVDAQSLPASNTCRRTWLQSLPLQSFIGEVQATRHRNYTIHGHGAVSLTIAQI